MCDELETMLLEMLLSYVMILVQTLLVEDRLILGLQLLPQHFSLGKN
jgi:hypothetical protein